MIFAVSCPLSLLFGALCHLGTSCCTGWCKNVSLPLGLLHHLDLGNVIWYWLVKDCVSGVGPVSVIVGDRMSLLFGVLGLLGPNKSHQDYQLVYLLL